EVFGLFAFGDINDHVADADDLAAGAHGVVAGEPVPHSLRLFRAWRTDLDIGYGFTVECSAVDVFELWPEVGDDFGHGATDLLGARGPVDPRQHLVDAHDPQIAVHELE